MELKELKLLGLTQGEIRVYIAILHIGIATINKIHEKTGLERRTIYDVINKLIEKGLISYALEGGRKTYQCTHPKKLAEEIDKKRKELMNLNRKIPEITKYYASLRPEIGAEIFRGAEGIKAVWEDMLNYKENYFIGAGWYIIKKLPYYWASYNKRRIKLKVKWHVLARYELKQEEIPERRLVDAKFLPPEFSINPAVIFIYGNKVANVLWGKEFFAFVIESKEIAENYKRYFTYLWNKVAEVHD